jgi:hypothetical protein
MSTAPTESQTADEAARRLLASYLRETETGERTFWRAQAQEYAAGRAILEADPAVQVAVLRLVLAAVATPQGEVKGVPVAVANLQDGLARLAAAQAIARQRAASAPAAAGDEAAEWAPAAWMVLDYWAVRTRFGPLLSALARRRLPYSDDDLCDLLASLGRVPRWDAVPARALLRAVERHVAEGGLTPAVRAALEQTRAAGEAAASHAEERKALAVLDALLADAPGDTVNIDADDDWGAAAREALAALEPAERPVWLALLAHAETASASKPSAAWRAAARRAIDALGEARFTTRAIAWLGLLQAPPSNEWRQGAGIGALVGLDRLPRAVPTERNATLLRGLVWCCSLVDDEALARAVGEAGAACFKKLPEIGARSTKVGNACLYALGAMPGPHGAMQLVALQRLVKQPSARARLDATMDQAATQAGLSRDDLEDRAVPTHGLVDGRLRATVGEYTAEIVVRGPRDVAVEWRDAAGALLPAEPAAVRRTAAAEAKRMGRAADEIRQTLLAQRDRVERLLMGEQRWPLGAWRALYLEHPLLVTLARRLIWTFETAGQRTLGAWADGGLVDVRDQPLDGLGEDTAVRLWHPITSTPEEVLAWRLWLERHAVTQPFKQAHREIYVLTDAERESGTDSERFAQHVLRQHQFQALCRERGWRAGLQGAFDGADPTPTLSLPRWGLRAQFSVEAIDDGDMLSPHAIYLYVSTEQVQFSREPRAADGPRPRRKGPMAYMKALISGEVEQFRADAVAAMAQAAEAQAPIPLAEVPPVVFSEVMRDVDLFVGVCSVGTDPAWRDTAPARYADYWNGFSVGELSASAHTRRAVLERLLPRLAIGPRCSLEERFLVVRGDLRTYRIHLGSGNVLMEPNSQYLCIVPARGAVLPGEPGHYYLPFEGDGLFAVILSKAFLLADDRAIKDPSITHQIRG